MLYQGGSLHKPLFIALHHPIPLPTLLLLNLNLNMSLLLSTSSSSTRLHQLLHLHQLQVRRNLLNSMVVVVSTSHLLALLSLVCSNLSPHLVHLSLRIHASLTLLIVHSFRSHHISTFTSILALSSAMFSLISEQQAFTRSGGKTYTGSRATPKHWRRRRPTTCSRRSSTYA